MKEITKERTKVEKYTVYEAVDGTQFDFKEDCEKYDNSAKGVLRGKLKALTVNDKYNGWDLMGGNEDNKILAISVPSQAAVDIILQSYYLDQSWILMDGREEYRNKVILAVNQAYREGDIVLFGINCDDELYFIDTRSNIINRLNNLDKKEEEE